MNSKKVFFVTGGSRGIGAGVVLRAAREGHHVAFTYRTRKDEADKVIEQAKSESPGSKVRAWQLEVSSSAPVEEVGNQVLDTFDTVDVVVPNAGININNLVVSMSDEEWNTVIQTNLTGAFYVVRYFLQTMIANRFGRIIFMSSLGAGGVSGQANYSASKAGLLGLSSALAKEYGRRGITSNVLMPGFFETDMTREGMSASNREFWLKYCPQGRVAGVEEISGVVTFLASERASFINGQAIPVNGGLDWAP
jgi:NAD(P)-dependent dehydrogenase (short-subunit alcohol dehydrogenase family)